MSTARTRAARAPVEIAVVDDRPVLPAASIRRDVQLGYRAHVLDVLAPFAGTAVDAQVREHAALVAAFRAKRGELSAHREDLASADAADRAAYARAARAGDLAPGTPNLHAHQQRSAELERGVTALDDAVEASFVDGVAAVAEQSDELLAASAAERASVRAELVAALDVAASAVARLNVLDHLDARVAGITADGVYVRPRSPQPRPLLAVGAQQYAAPELLALISRSAAPAPEDDGPSAPALALLADAA